MRASAWLKEAGLQVFATTLFAVRCVQAQPATPPRDRPVQIGTGVIQGRVVDGQSGTAIARARVRVNLPAGPGGQTVMTDAAGNFVFTRPPPGILSLYVEKSTYLSAAFPESAPTFRANSRRLTLAANRRIGDLVIRVFHDSAITGHVLIRTAIRSRALSSTR